MQTIFAPPEVIQKWCAALRSGEYQQATGSLTDGIGYCCLGVLQMVLDGQVERFKDSNDYLCVPSIEWLRAHGIRFVHHSISVGQEAEAMNPTLPALKTSAASANDDGLDFDTIAAAIEQAAKP